MKRLLLVPLLALGLFLGMFSMAWAQQEVEIVPLKSRTVDQVLPVLQPLVEPGGAVSGMNNQLIIKGSRRNREQLKQVLASIDTPPRMLRIRVTQNRDLDSRGRDVGVSGNVGLGGNVSIIQSPGAAGTLNGSGSLGRSGGGSVQIQRGGSSVTTEIVDTRSTRSSSAGQMVQVMEGGRAFIQMGQSVPVPLRQAVLGPNGVVVTESTVYRDLGQGFYAEPHLAGDRVTLEISPQNDTPGSYGPGSANIQRLSTTVSGRLGEWIALGGMGQESSGRDRANSTLSTQDVRDNRTVWLLVEEIK